MTLYQIKYTDIRTGERKAYMNIGFNTKEEVRMKLDLLLREAKKWKQIYHIDDMNTLERIPAAAVGSYWRIKKVNCTPV
jgi:hypothetical protein